MDVLSVDFKANDAQDLFTRSLRETGFAVINNHPIDQSLIQKVYSDWREFFADDRKFDYHFEESTHDGYFPLDVSETAQGYNIKDIKEYFHVYPWGQYPDFIGPATKQLSMEMTHLAAIFLQWIEDNTPEEIKNRFSMPLSEMIKDSPKTLFRILHYPPLTGNEGEGAVRAAEHQDVNLITLLPAATASGLQVKDSFGRWHDVSCDYDSLLVNIADMLQLVTDGYYPSTTHRVCNPKGKAAKESRLSMPLFLHPRSEVRLSRNYTAKEFWEQRMREIGVLS